MAIFYSDAQTIINGPAFGQPLQNKVKANRLNARIRYAEFSYVAPQTGTPQIADKIVFGKLPVKSRIVGHLSQLRWTTGTASSTLSIGDNGFPARHLAATAITTAGTAAVDAAAIAPTATANTVSGSNVLSNIAGLGAFQIGDILSGTGIATGATVTAIQQGSSQATSTVIMSLNATATGTSVTVTSTGSSYEFIEESNSLGNLFTSTTDDCTLVGTVAGAAIAAGQAILLKVAYTQD